MIAAVSFLVILVNRQVSYRLYALVAILAFLVFPEYIYAFGTLSLQKLIAVLFFIEAVRIQKADFLSISKTTLWVFAFFAVLLVSSFLSDTYEGVQSRAISVSFQYLSLYLFVSAVLKSGMISYSNLLWIIVIAFLLNVPVVLVEQLTSKNLGQILTPIVDLSDTEWGFVAKENERFGRARSQGLLVSPLSLSILAVFSVVAAFANLHLSRVWNRLIAVSGFISLVGLALFVVIASGSRSGVLALAAVLYSFFLVSRFKSLVIVLSGLSILFVLILLPLNLFSELSSILDPVLGQGEYSGLANSNNVRVMQISESIEAFKLSPIVGHGADSAIHFMTYYTIDSFWLSLFVNFGLVGGGIFLYLYLSIVVRVKKAGKELMLPFSVMFLVFSIVVSLNYLFMLFFMTLAVFNFKSRARNPLMIKYESIISP